MSGAPADDVVYINDDPIGETDVYHARRAHVSTRSRIRDKYVREATVTEARDEGLRPCKQCFPTASGTSCPACGYPDPGDQQCPNDDCRVLSFRTTGEDTGEMSNE